MVDLCNDLCSPKAPKRLASSSVKVKVEQATGQKSTKKREPEPLEPAGEPKRGFFTKELIDEVASSLACESHFGPHKHHQTYDRAWHSVGHIALHTQLGTKSWAHFMELVCQHHS